MDVIPELNILAKFMTDNDVSSIRLYKTGKLKIRQNANELPSGIGRITACINGHITNRQTVVKDDEETIVRIVKRGPKSYNNLSEEQLCQLISEIAREHKFADRILTKDQIDRNPYFVQAKLILKCFKTVEPPPTLDKHRFFYGKTSYFDIREVYRLVRRQCVRDNLKKIIADCDRLMEKSK